MPRINLAGAVIMFRTYSTISSRAPGQVRTRGLYQVTYWNSFCHRETELRSVCYDSCQEQRLKLTGNLAVRYYLGRLGGPNIGRNQSFLGLVLGSTNRQVVRAFQTSAPHQAPRDSSTIDFFFFPEIPEPEQANPFSKIRVPLLLDTLSGHAAEAPDEALPRFEISIVAGHPENVAPAALSEVVGNDSVDVDIDQLTAGFSASPLPDSRERGILQELWNDMVDDIFGPGQDSQEISNR